MSEDSPFGFDAPQETSEVSQSTWTSEMDGLLGPEADRGVAVFVSGFGTGSSGREVGLEPTQTGVGEIAQQPWVAEAGYQAEVVGWDQTESAVEAVQNYLAANPDGQVAVVGHSLGADTAVEITEELGARGIEVDRLVLVESIGAGDEVVPVTVGQALNIFATELEVADGATQVEGAVNIGLSDTSHTEIDNDPRTEAIIESFLTEPAPSSPWYIPTQDPISFESPSTSPWEISPPFNSTNATDLDMPSPTVSWDSSSE